MKSISKIDSKQLTELELKSLKLELLFDLTSSINNNFSNNSLITIYSYILSEKLNINQFIFFLKDDKNWTIAQNHRTAFFAEVDPSKIFTEVIRPSKIDISLSKMFPDLQTVIPVFHKREPFAYLLMSAIDSESETYKKEIIDYIQVITNIVAVASENKKLFKNQVKQELFKKELSVAAQIQGMLIPETLPSTDKIEMAAIYVPNNNIGGDYYDCVKISECEFIFCVADVSGKGIPAALLMSNFQAHMRALVKVSRDLKHIVTELNKSMFELTKGDRFITLFLGKINCNEQSLSYINCGHQPLVIVNKEKCSALKKGTTMLGAFDELPFINEEKVTFLKKDVLSVFTDGITELENYKNDFFTIELLVKSIKENFDKPIDDINTRLLQTLNEFRGNMPFTDDVTLLTIRLK